MSRYPTKMIVRPNGTGYHWLVMTGTQCIAQGRATTQLAARQAAREARERWEAGVHYPK